MKPSSCPSIPAAAALDAYIVDDFLLEQCIIPLLRHMPFQIDWFSHLSQRTKTALAVAVIRCCTLWITRGRLPGARAVGLSIDYKNNRWRLLLYSLFRGCLPVLYQMLIDYKETSTVMLQSKSHTSVQHVRAIRRRNAMIMSIAGLMDRILPTLRWAAWTTAFWGNRYLGEEAKTELISPELEMRLSGLSYQPIAATQDSSNSLRETRLNCAYAQRRWLWEILVRSVQLYTAGLMDIPQLLTELWRHPIISRFRVKVRELQGLHADLAHHLCIKCGQSPTNAVQVTGHGKPVYECYLCTPNANP